MILDFHDRHPREGYRRVTFMMLDDVVAVRPGSTYHVLKSAGRLDRYVGYERGATCNRLFNSPTPSIR